MVKQEKFNAYFGRQLKQNAYMIEHLGDYMSRVKGELKLISKHASMVTTQVEQVLKAQNDLLNEMNSKKNDYAVRVATRTGRMTQEPLYPKGDLNLISKHASMVITQVEQVLKAQDDLLNELNNKKMIMLLEL